MSFFGNLHATLVYMGHFWPLGVLCFIALKAGGGYVPPPNGGPGGDMGMGKTVKKAFKRVVNPAGADEDERRNRKWY